MTVALRGAFAIDDVTQLGDRRVLADRAVAAVALDALAQGVLAAVADLIVGAVAANAAGHAVAAVTVLAVRAAVVISAGGVAGVGQASFAIGAPVVAAATALDTKQRCGVAVLLKGAGVGAVGSGGAAAQGAGGVDTNQARSAVTVSAASAATVIVAADLAVRAIVVVTATADTVIVGADIPQGALLVSHAADTVSCLGVTDHGELAVPRSGAGLGAAAVDTGIERGLAILADTTLDAGPWRALVVGTKRCVGGAVLANSATADAVSVDANCALLTLAITLTAWCAAIIAAVCVAGCADVLQPSVVSHGAVLANNVEVVAVVYLAAVGDTALNAGVAEVKDCGVLLVWIRGVLSTLTGYQAQTDEAGSDVHCRFWI